MGTRGNSIDSTTAFLIIDPRSSSDSWLRFADVNSSDTFCIGVDNSDDSFHISRNASIGTNDYFIMQSSGIYTKPQQPSFLGYLASNDTGVITGSTYAVGTNVAYTEAYDVSSDFNASTGVFTAPITATFLFNFALTVYSLSSINGLVVHVTTSNNDLRLTYLNPAILVDGDGYATVRGTGIFPMDASDTAYIKTQAVGVGSGNISGSNNNTYFSGSLLV